MSCKQPQPNTCTHIRTYTHTEIKRYAIIHLQTYICTENNNTTIFITSTPGTAQNRTPDTTKQYAAHTRQHREHTYTSTQNNLHTYSFDFYDEHIYIKKLYNTAIYKLYTILIHFARLINEVSKIILIYRKTLYNRNNIVIED